MIQPSQMKSNILNRLKSFKLIQCRKIPIQITSMTHLKELIAKEVIRHIMGLFLNSKLLYLKIKDS